ncbi:sugar phosphate isomerase/epimerase family protein [Rubrimonas cliftonensis]|uniref:Sugar phosphate isomerase/epimerase n=1 Tax=Rubrimonas cliftonensis TaxID=89524 RepID=A0A1H4CLD9_9RHOB|nr:TIM barrel protein [Rubrimonas cliftonensis]SEA61177.1 Sugar phosphate isomerase/epimerase [Rubrimonas cliftonensis]
MTTNRPRPTLGACMPLADAPAHLDWLTEGGRSLELQDFVEADLLNGDWRGRVAEARALLGGWQGRLGLHGPFWGFTIATQDPDVRAVVARRMDQALDAADALGADQIVIHSPYTTWDHNNLDMAGAPRAQVIDRVHACIGAAVKRAEALGVVFVIENIEDKDPRDRLSLAQSFGSPAVKLSIDTGHAHYAHVATGAPPVDYYVRAAGDMLAHVHLQDADGYADRHWAPGMGTVNFAAIFAALAETGAEPRLNLELRDTSEIAPAAARLAAMGVAV